ncbi:glycoside hydrolase [Hypoxylon trugodes]|uniref:glycoside hydrolase n=1 Tax=Hypoxylon trugodes TaxID=326681 RepID=UPI0021A072C4|nr:glycoside hydrolase [Hypoxylon trugodes]KAI1386059.1 glycoside hydrolase [Hypoxylon trugodes]
MAKVNSLYSSWLTSLLLFITALAPLSGAAYASTPTSSASPPSSTGTSTPDSDSLRIVQYAGTLYAPGSSAKVHVAELVNSTRPVHVTNVLWGTWTLWSNKTMVMTKGGTNIDPSIPSNAWALTEMKTVQKAGVAVSMFMRGGWGNFNNDSNFDTYYSVLHDTLKKYGFDGIDLDIEDNTDGNEHPITIEPVTKLVKRLRQDFGPDFVITLAPVSTAMAGSGSNLSKFSYKELEKRAGDAISWYNVQFYYLSNELGSTASVDSVINNGWSPERIVIGMMTTPDFPPFIEFSKVAKTLQKLKKKYPAIRGIDGFDYYDQKPGGYPAPWEWPRWAVRQMKRSGDGGAAPSAGVRGMVFKA